MSAGASSKLAAFWNHPAGPKTIHFWAPTFKCETYRTPALFMHGAVWIEMPLLLQPLA